MILSKTSNNNWTPTAGGTGTFIGTKAAFDAVKATLPDNTVAYITDDGNGDLQPVDAVTNGDMHPVTSNAVYDRLKPKVWTSSINIGTSVWAVTITRSVDFVHVRLRCTASGTVSSESGTTVTFTGAPDWCKVKYQISTLTTFESAVIDLIGNSITCWYNGNLANNSEWNATVLAFDADV